eukprot:TRINITY_DN1441_c0_g1_i3.p1 TRINITY_DN1441_c0_g1~~TRINITY_DN1441_c0_g1_i3.p1  ORF type:complete len:503 (-),score=117.10 TRINITY_DN1441_c0_g1_i3:472-1902(-)
MASTVAYDYVNDMEQMKDDEEERMKFTCRIPTGSTCASDEDILYESITNDESDNEKDKSPWSSNPVYFADNFQSPFGGFNGFPKLETATDKVSTLNGIPSVGSALHASGNCTPCSWFWKQSGCQNGEDCRHCHLCPKSEVRARKKDKMKQKKHSQFHRQSPPEITATTAKTSSMQIGKTVEDPQRVQPQADDVLSLADIRAPPGLELDLDQSIFRPPPGLELIDEDTTHDGLSMECTEDNDKHSQNPTDDDDDDDDEITVVDGKADAHPVYLTVGSLDHYWGTCKPCSFFWRPQGCHNGADCRHCHLCPRTAVKQRKRRQEKVKREMHTIEIAAKQIESQQQMIIEANMKILQLERQMRQQTPMQQFSHTSQLPQQMQLGQLMLQQQQLALAQQQQMQILLPPVFPVPAPSDVVAAVAVAASGSAGSSDHAIGACKPCAWFWKPQGCEHGSKCKYCHLCGPDEIKKRKKAMRMLGR